MQRRRPLAPRNDLETRLWLRLRELDGYRFRRRAPFRTFTLDFVEHDARLVISLEEGAPGSRSPVHIVRDRLLSDKVIDEAGLKNIDREIKDIVSIATEFAQTSPEPDPSEMWTDVLVDA